MKTIYISILFFALLFVSCSEEKRLIRKAANAIDQSDYKKAISYYDQILAKDSASFRANAGKGIVLSEFVGDHKDAIPYLEKALAKSPEEVSVKINGDLGKSYHHIGNYSRAIKHYSKITSENTEDSPYYDQLLNKRIADCRFAMEHTKVASPEEQWVKNVGTTINSEYPEYGPVNLGNGTFIFTSKRKDTPKEKKNGLDGRYFESMYIANYSNGKFSEPRRYTIPDKGLESDFYKGNESAVTASPDGKSLFIYKAGELYKADLSHPENDPEKLSSKINFLDFQTYAFITPDERQMFLVAESERNGGGSDIYQSFKKEDGTWSKPFLLPFNINTDYNEDSPFMTEDGTLFFASNGLPGYGGYDIYKTKYVNGTWTDPVNIGQPINTPGDDLFFVLNPNSSKGFYASDREGGYGDIDIYHVHYVNMDIPQCQELDTNFVINSAMLDSNNVYSISASLPEKYKNNVRSITWEIDNVEIPQTNDQINYRFDNEGTYTIHAKAVVYCDSCPTLLAVCSEKLIQIGEPMIVYTDSAGTNSTTLNVIGELTNDQLKNIGWNTSLCLFDYDKYDIRPDAKQILDQNIKVLKTYRDLTLVINGYADSRGTNNYNYNLSSQRINSVKNYLIRNGISKHRITDTMAYGESKITNGCVDDVECTEDQHQENRKVDFKVNNNKPMYTNIEIQPIND